MHNLTELQSALHLVPSTAFIFTGTWSLEENEYVWDNLFGKWKKNG